MGIDGSVLTRGYFLAAPLGRFWARATETGVPHSCFQGPGLAIIGRTSYRFMNIVMKQARKPALLCCRLAGTVSLFPAVVSVCLFGSGPTALGQAGSDPIA